MGEYESSLNIDLNTIIENYHNHMNDFAFNLAIDTVCNFTNKVNKFIDHAAPWGLYKEKKLRKLEKVLYIALESIRKLSILFYPFIPSSMEKVFSWLKLSKSSSLLLVDSLFDFPPYPQEIQKTDSLFPRIKRVTK